MKNFIYSKTLLLVMRERTVVEITFTNDVHPQGKEKGLAVKSFNDYRNNNLNVKEVNIKGNKMEIWFKRRETVMMNHIQTSTDFLNKNLKTNPVKEVDVKSKNLSFR